MTKSELLLASRFLERAGHEFARHGCNDTDAELSAGISEVEGAVLASQVSIWNSSDPQEQMEFKYIPDFAWMAYLADRLEKEAERAGASRP